MKQIFKKYLLSLALLTQGSLTLTGSQEVIQEVKNAIKNDAYYWVEGVSTLAIGIGGVIACADYHANGLKYMQLGKQVGSATLLVGGTVLLAQTQGPWGALIALALGITGAYHGTKPEQITVDFEV